MLNVPVPAITAAKLRRAVTKIEEWSLERDRLIVEARRSGGSLREIGLIVGMTAQGVAEVEKRVLRRS